MHEKNNLFIYSNYDFSQRSAGCTRMMYYAKALANNTTKVYLVSCVSTKISNENFIEVEPNVFILQDKKLTTGLFSTLQFLRNLALFSTLKSGNSTFMYYPSTLIYLECFGLLYLKTFKKLPVFSELNEVPKHSSDFHESLSLKRINYSLKKIIFKSIFTLMEPLLYFYDGLICISTAMEKYAKQFNNNTIRIPILTNPDIDIVKSNNSYISEGFFNIGFSGSIHPRKENLESFIGIISKLVKKGFDVSFNLCGIISKDYVHSFLEMCQSKSEINYFGNLNEIEMSTFLSQQDLLVVPRGYSLQNKYGFSTKLSDYLNHKKIVLVTDISDNNLYISDGVNGFIVPPDNENEMCKKLTYIMENLNQLKHQVIPNAMKISKTKFHYQIYEHKLRTFLFSG